MKKQIIKTLIVLIIIVISLFALSFSASAEGTAELMETYTGTCGDNLTWTLDTSTGVLTISGTGEMDDWYMGGVPEWVSCGYTDRITEIVIHQGVTSIGGQAFYDCVGVTSVTIPNSVRSIGNSAFCGCLSLSNVIIPDGVRSIGDSAFYDCSNLTDLIIPDSVTSIGSAAFYGCSRLEEFTIPKGVTGIAQNTFWRCNSLKSIIISEGVTNIDYTAFDECTSLLAFSVESGNQSYCAEDGVLFTGDKTRLIKYPAGKTAASYTIPDEVIELDDHAFYDCDKLTSITVPSNVTDIRGEIDGEEMFAGCSSLSAINVDSDNPVYCSEDGILFNKDKTILLQYPCSKAGSAYQIPETVKSIGRCAFDQCSKLTGVIIPSNVTSVELAAFRGCSSLTTAGPIGSGCSIEFGWTSEIPEIAFSFCESLTSTFIPSGVKNIGAGAFENCSSLTSITLPDTLESMGESAFAKCISLKTINLPDSLTRLGSDVFYGCSALTEITIPDGVTSIEGNTFCGCSSLTNLSIPDSITSIGERAFSGSGLTNIAIPDGVTSIGEYAFYWCNKLTSIKIPFSVTNIGFFAFSGCSSLKTVKYIGTESQWQEITIGVYNESLLDANIEYLVQSGSCGEKLTWTLNTITGELTISGSGKMYDWRQWSFVSHTFSDPAPWDDYRNQIKTITINEGATSIGSAAFTGCSSLTAITIPTSITSIEASALSNCTGLTEVIIPDSVTSIWGSAFYGCSSLTDIKISESIKSIPYNLFYGCSSLKEITIPDSVTSIGESAFRECKSLVHVTIPNGVTVIDKYAFYKCSSLNSVTIPNSVTSIKDWAFTGCNDLKEITIPDSVTDIGSSAFNGCNSLTNIIIPSNVKSIGSYAFYRCSSLTEVTIPDSTESLGAVAFGACTALHTFTVDSDNPAYCAENGVLYNKSKTQLIQYPAGRTETSYQILNTATIIGKYAFYGCKSLTDITVPSSVTSIGASAFSDCTGLANITMPASVTNIESDIFKGCVSLTSAGPIGSGCSLEFGWTTAIPAGAFDGCSGLTGITIPNTVTSIGDYALHGCSSLAGITIPETVTSIGNSALYGCSSLKHITIPEGVKNIGSFAFGGCAGLVSAGPIGSGCSFEYGWETMLPEHAFGGCDSLASITVPETVTSIGAYAFGCCSSLKSITIPDGVTNIRSMTFCWCSGLVDITLPEGITSISYDAFMGCYNLRTVFFGGTKGDWQAISSADELNNVDLFSTDNYDEELYVEITTQDVPGGVKVSMSKTGDGTIYYTLDGTMPCTASIPYTGPFLLKEAGDIFVNAMVIIPSIGTYGDTTTEFVALEQSKAPQVYEQNGTVVMNGATGCIYYTFDLTAEPSTSSAKYESPILLSETKVVRAKVIETGKVPSSVVSYAFYVTAGGIDYPDDSYCFTNTASSFGYGKNYRIRENRYREIFGDAVGKFLYNEYSVAYQEEYYRWAGNCFGMSATSLMFANGMLNLHDYSITAQSVYDLPAPKATDSNLTQLIERYQLSQFLREVIEEKEDAIHGGNMVHSGEVTEAAAGDRLLSAIQKACSGGEPIVLIIWAQQMSHEHAVVPYKLADGKIYIYDCDIPGMENTISYEKSQKDGSYTFNYKGMYNYGFAVAYISLNRLLSKLEGFETGQADLTANGKEQLLVSLNTSSFRIVDENGNEVTNYTTIHASDMIQASETILYLDVGNYTILNQDSTLEEFTISAATESDYCTVTVEDPAAEIQIGIENEHLFMSVTSEKQVALSVCVLTAASEENTIETTADYLKVYTYSDTATIVETTATGIIGNGEEINLTEDGQNGGIYYGAVGHKLEAIAQEAYEENVGIRVSTDITGLIEETFTLTANVTGAGETAVVYAASYDAAGKMTDIHSWETQSGKTKYPFTIEAGTAAVKIYVLDKNTSKPLTESLTLRQG
ncbi:MAG: leucine-rich repeat protein [Oscillospiraceae bacterium]|nr:leucine-rich repeat protein [Oscillospiraceae bacterium]